MLSEKPARPRTVRWENPTHGTSHTVLRFTYDKDVERTSVG